MQIETAKSVGQIAAEDTAATREFEKLGIDCCCGGERTLGEACAAPRISVDEVLERVANISGRSPRASRQRLEQPYAPRLFSQVNPLACSANVVFVHN